MKMDTVTYPTPEIGSFVNTFFTPVRVDVKNVLPEQREIVRATRPLWTPMIVVRDTGSELRRTTGHADSEEFLCELEIGLALSEILHQRFLEAHARLMEVANRARHSTAAEEALFWAGVAMFKSGARLEGLTPIWNELQGRFPGSLWARRSDVLDMLGKV